jgi:hypothetical protein
MRKLLTLSLLILALALSCPAQTATPLPDQWAGAGVFFNQYAAPQINGTLAYAKRVMGGGTYSFTAVNFLSYSTNPFRVMTSTETGIAQHLTTFGPFEVQVLGTLGPAFAADPATQQVAPDGTTTVTSGGTKVGLSLTGGGFAFARLKNGWTIGPVLRVTKPTISDTQWSIGLMIGWGK